MTTVEQLQEVRTDIANCNDLTELQEIKEMVDSLRTTVENRIKAVESEGE